MLLFSNRKYNVMKAILHIETGSRMVVARGWREGEMGSYCLMGQFQFCKMKQVLWMDVGDGSTAV